jgi:hypothetical protein
LRCAAARRRISPNRAAKLSSSSHSSPPSPGGIRCRAEAALLNAYYQHYRSRGLQVIGRDVKGIAGGRRPARPPA